MDVHPRGVRVLRKLVLDYSSGILFYIVPPSMNVIPTTPTGAQPSLSYTIQYSV